MNIEAPLIFNDDTWVDAPWNVETPLTFNDDTWVEPPWKVETPETNNVDEHVDAFPKIGIDGGFSIAL